MAVNKPALILRRNVQTGELSCPLCWDDEWYIFPLFAVAYGPNQICLWRKGWRKVAGFLRNEVSGQQTVINGA